MTVTSLISTSSSSATICVRAVSTPVQIHLSGMDRHFAIGADGEEAIDPIW